MINFILQGLAKDTSFYLYFAYASMGVIIFSYVLSLLFRARDKKKE